MRALADRTPAFACSGAAPTTNWHATSRRRSPWSTPRDEDYGLVAAEAHAAGRPILTTTDSGGIAEQVLASSPPAGMVVPPMARFLGNALRDLALDPAASDRMGEPVRPGADPLWQPLLDLVDHETAGAAQPRPRVLMLSTFVAEPVTGGGSRRLRAVANRLQSFADVTVLTLTNEVTGIRNRLLPDGVVQLAVGRSRPHLKADHEMQALVGVPVDDIAVGPLHRATPAFAPLLAALVDATDLIVLAHPFLAPTIPPGTKKPTV